MNKDKPDHCFPTDPYRETHDKRTGFICPENRKCMCFQCDSKGCEHWMAEIPNIPTYHMNSELVKTHGDMKTMANDLISRQAAVDAIVGMTTMSIEELANAGNKERFDWIKGLSDSLVKINNLPSAEPQHDCNTCRYNDLKWYEEPCDSCTGGGKSNHWKPSADVVEVVRCKDCKWWDIADDEDMKECINSGGYWKADEFCSDAERRTDE